MCGTFVDARTTRERAAIAFAFDGYGSAVLGRLDEMQRLGGEGGIDRSAVDGRVIVVATQK